MSQKLKLLDYPVPGFLVAVAIVLFFLNQTVYSGVALILAMLVPMFTRIVSDRKASEERYENNTQARIAQIEILSEKNTKELDRQASLIEATSNRILKTMGEQMRNSLFETRRITDLSLFEHIDQFLVGDPEQQVLSAYAKNRLHQLRREVQFSRLAEQSKIRELYLGQIFNDIDPVTVPVGAIHELTGHPNKVDMIYVCAVAKHLKAKTVFEFGTYMGRTTHHLAGISDDVQVTTLNLPVEESGPYAPYIGSYFKGKESERRINRVFVNSYDFDTTPLKESFDFVFVDADHSYEAVLNDTKKAFELLKPGGTIMWHDYAPKSIGLVKAMKEIAAEKPLFRLKNTCLLLYIDGVDPLSFPAHKMLDTLEGDFGQDDPYKINEIYRA